MKKIINQFVRLLKRRKIKISVAESCTGGMLSNAITSVSGSSKIFNMGLVTYSNDAKKRVLKVPEKIIESYGSVSAQCCLSMVRNLSKISKSQICISITGIAGPGGGSKLKPIGLVYIGLKNGKKITIYKFLFKNKNRQHIQKITVRKTLSLITQILN